MDNAEPYDTVTVLLRLEGFEGMGPRSAWVILLMIYRWIPPTVGGQVFSEKRLHRCGRGDPALREFGGGAEATF